MGDAAPVDLAHAIRVVAHGHWFVSPALSRQLLEHQRSEENLSEEQKELCCLLAAGYEEPELETSLNRDGHPWSADLQAIHDALERRKIPEVLRKCIWENQRFLEQARR